MIIKWEMDQHEGSFQNQFSEMFKRFCRDHILTICVHVKGKMDFHYSFKEMIS